jgi:hypothetical protein
MAMVEAARSEESIVAGGRRILLPGARAIERPAENPRPPPTAQSLT